jgi:hypothetical protein
MRLRRPDWLRWDNNIAFALLVLFAMYFLWTSVFQ